MAIVQAAYTLEFELWSRRLCRALCTAYCGTAVLHSVFCTACFGPDVLYSVCVQHAVGLTFCAMYFVQHAVGMTYCTVYFVQHVVRMTYCSVLLFFVLWDTDYFIHPITDVLYSVFCTACCGTDVL